MLEQTLLFLSCVLTGVMTGIYVCSWIHDHRVADLGAREYVAMHQMRDKTFRRVMPVVAIGTILLVLASAIAASGPGVRFLASAATVLLVVDMIWTVRKQLPLNQLIQSWSPGGIPNDWSVVRDKWSRQHSARGLISAFAYLTLLAALAT